MGFWRKPTQTYCDGYVPAIGCCLTPLPGPLKIDEPLYVFPVANGFAVMRAPAPLKHQAEIRGFWDKKSMLEFVESHFRWPRDSVTAKVDK